MIIGRQQQPQYRICESRCSIFLENGSNELFEVPPLTDAPEGAHSVEEITNHFKMYGQLIYFGNIGDLLGLDWVFLLIFLRVFKLHCVYFLIILSLSR